MLLIFWSLSWRSKLAMLLMLAVGSLPGIAYTSALINIARQAAIIWPCPFCCAESHQEHSDGK